MEFDADYAGIGELLRADFMQAEMLRRVEKGKALAEVIAPRDTGQFAASFHTSVNSHGGARHDRAEGVLTNDDPAALSIETGTNDTPAHRTLRKSLDAMKD